MKSLSNVLVLHDKSAESTTLTRNIELMKGHYDFKFGSSTVTLKQKLEKVTVEPMAYYLYKRRDLEQKIDKLAVNQLRMAKLVYTVTQNARADREEYLQIKKEEEEKKMYAGLTMA